MNWLVVATIAYFLTAFAVILDKFLLSSKKVSHPAIYAFYSGLLSLSAFLLFPFGFHLVSLNGAILSIFAGIIFIFGILSLFFALTKSEASQVVPTVGAATPVATYFFSMLLLGEKLSNYQILGLFALISGGLLISLEISGKDKRAKKGFFSGFPSSILAGVLLAVAFTLFKNLFEQDNFINVYIWTRFGLLAGSISLLFHPGWRKAILSSLKGFKNPQETNKRSGLLFVFNKILGGSGSILLNFAISIGSVTLVNALVSVEYVFIFILGILFSHWFPDFFQERKNPGVILQKIAAIVIITFGLVMVSK